MPPKEGASPLVSVVVPAFNVERTIADAIDSVYATGYPALEVIVVDDGSTDGTAQVLESYLERHSERTIRVAQHTGGRNLGIVASRNAALRLAKGEFVALLDADDLFLPNRFAKCIPFLRENSEVDATFEPFEYLHEDGERSQVMRSMSAERVLGEEGGRVVLDSPWSCSEDLYVALLQGRLSKHPTSITLRRRVFDKYGLFPPTSIVTDRVLWLKLFATGGIRPCGDTPVSLYRIHGQSICSRMAGTATALAGPLWALTTAYTWMRYRRDVSAAVKQMSRTQIFGKFCAYCSGVLRTRHRPVEHLMWVPLRTLCAVPSLAFRKHFWSALVLLWLRAMGYRKGLAA